MVSIYVLGKALFLSKTHEGEHFFWRSRARAHPNFFIFDPSRRIMCAGLCPTSGQRIKLEWALPTSGQSRRRQSIVTLFIIG